MSPLLARAIWRDSARHPAQLALCILGVTLSVALVVAVDLASESARRGFDLARSSVVGKATHHVVSHAGGGVPEEVYRDLKLAGLEVPMAPIVEGTASSRDRTLRVLGIDPYAEGPFRTYLTQEARTGSADSFFTENHGVLIGEVLAQEFGLFPGEKLKIRIEGIERDVLVLGTFLPRDALSRTATKDLLVCDIAVAQRLFDSFNVLDRIDLVIENRPLAQERLQELLPDGVVLEDAGAASKTFAKMTHAFRLNLRALSLLALVAGGFLAYNTMSFSVVRRRTWIGVIRAIGVTRREVLGAILGEVLLIGVLGTCFGFLVGWGLGHLLVSMVLKTMSDLYTAVDIADYSVKWETFALACSLGLGGTLIAALRPLMECLRLTPRDLQSRSVAEASALRGSRTACMMGLVVIAVSMLILWVDDSVFLGFTSMFGVIVGGSLLVPVVVHSACRIVRSGFPISLGFLGRMAIGGISASLSRTGIAIAALMVSISVVVGVGVMIESFRGTLAQWLNTTLRADIYVSPPTRTANRNLGTMNEEVRRSISALNLFAGMSSYRGVELMSDHGPLSMSVFNLDIRGRESFQFLEEDEGLWEGWVRGESVLVSEPLAFRRRLKCGDTIVLPTIDGPIARPISGVFQDYGNEAGKVVISSALYRTHWRDEGVTSLGLYLADGVDLDGAAKKIQDVVGSKQELLIRSNREIRRATMDVFNETFAITSVLKTLAVIVAFLGVLGALMAIQVEKTREIGFLRAIGLGPRGVFGLTLAQSGFMGILAGFMALPMGVALGWMLTFVINKRSFGWTLRFEIPSTVLLQAIVLAFVASLLAGIYPAYRASRSVPSLVIREE